MRTFVDTSSLFKKYVDEPGSEEFEALLAKAAEIAVAPLTWIEFNAAVAHGVRARSLTATEADALRADARRDFVHFWHVLWNENLEDKTVEIVRRYAFKSLDAVQLASGILSGSDLFVTSDRKLFEEAKKILRHARLV